MKSIHATLLAAQQAPSGRPIARASLADNGRLHFVRQHTQSWDLGRVVGVRCGGFFVRAATRLNGPADVVVQKVTDPTQASQWSTWTTVATGVASAAVALFWTGAYAVVVWQDLASLELRFRRSADGLTWSAAAVAYAPGDYPDFDGVCGGATHSGLVLGLNDRIALGLYDAGLNTWAALDYHPATFTGSGDAQISGFYDASNDRHVVGAAISGLVSWSRFGLTLFTRASTGTWSAGRVLRTSEEQGIGNLRFSQEQINGLWWLSCHKPSNWAMATNSVACSDDGEAWEDTYLSGSSPHTVLSFLGELPGYSGVWCATQEDIFTTESVAYWSNAAVVRYQFAQGSRLTRIYAGRGAHLVCTVDNRAGTLAAPRIHALLTLERGYCLEGVDYYQPAGVWHVTGARFLEGDNLLEIRAVDAVGLLTSWVADTAFTFAGETLRRLVELICALAGIHRVSFDASPLWDKVIDRFTHPANEDGRLSLESLMERAPFDFAVRDDGEVYFYLPAASPAAVYTYGAGGHAHWPGQFGLEQAPNYTMLIGSPPRVASDDDGDLADQARVGRRFTERLHDRRVKSAADAQQVTAARLLTHAERRRWGQFESPPNLALELGDVIAFAGSTWPALNGPWRVESFVEQFNLKTPARKFLQRVVLRGTA